MGPSPCYKVSCTVECHLSQWCPAFMAYDHTRRTVIYLRVIVTSSTKNGFFLPSFILFYFFYIQASHTSIYVNVRQNWEEKHNKFHCFSGGFTERFDEHEYDMSRMLLPSQPPDLNRTEHQRETSDDTRHHQNTKMMEYLLLLLLF